MKPSMELEAARIRIDRRIGEQVKSRSYRAANELRNASQLVLRGQRNGRRYIVPGTGRMKYYKRTKKAKITYKYYTASAPGEPPAVRTGAFRAGWMRKVVTTADGDKYVSVSPQIVNRTKANNGHLLGDYLENGTPGGKMAPRPHHQKIKDMAKPKILKIYKEPYF